MSETCDCSSQDLKEGVQVLSLVVEMCGIGVNFRQITGEEGLLAVQLLFHNVTVHAMEEVILCFEEQVSGSIPWSEGRLLDLLK